MELEAVKKLIKDYMPGHTEFVMQADIGERYYCNKNDILYREKNRENNREDQEEEKEKNPLL